MVTGDGKIHKSLQFSVWCATCDNLIDYSEYKNKSSAMSGFRKQGWRKTELGWQCKNCIARDAKDASSNGV